MTTTDDPGLELFESFCGRVAQAFEAACEGALSDPDLQGAYLSPLWESETSDATQARAWKRSVLRRVVGAGAEPWGHVFLVVLRDRDKGTGLKQLSEGIPSLRTASSEPPTTVTLSEGPPRVLLLVRPRAPGTSNALQGFVHRVRASFVPPT